MPPWGARRTASSALSLNRAASLALGRAASAPLPVRVLPAHRTPLQLFVFDTRRGNREGCESDKALAFYPPEMPPDDQLGTIGLAQALVTFIGTFAPGEGRLHTLETERHWWGVKRFEEGIWFGVVVEKTWGPGRMGGGACGALLEEVYAWTLMLHGSVNRLLERDPSGQGAAVSVQAVIEMWGDRLVGARGKGDKGDKGEYESPFGLARHRAVPAIPLGRAAALATQEVACRLLATTHNNMKPVKAVLIVYDSFLIWSTLNTTMTHTVFSYATQTLSTGFKSPWGQRRSSTLKIPTSDGTIASCWLVTVTQGLLTFFLLIDEFSGGARQVLNQVRTIMSAKSKQIAGAAAGALDAQNRFHISGYRYLLLDVAMRFGTVSPGKKLIHLTRKTLNLLAQAQAWLMDKGVDGGGHSEGMEIAAKGDHGGWVYVRTGFSKSLSVALEQLPDEGLLQVAGHVSKLCEKFFPGYFDM